MKLKRTGGILFGLINGNVSFLYLPSVTLYLILDSLYTVNTLNLRMRDHTKYLY